MKRELKHKRENLMRNKKICLIAVLLFCSGFACFGDLSSAQNNTTLINNIYQIRGGYNNYLNLYIDSSNQATISSSYTSSFYNGYLAVFDQAGYKSFLQYQQAVNSNQSSIIGGQDYPTQKSYFRQVLGAYAYLEDNSSEHSFIFVPSQSGVYYFVYHSSFEFRRMRGTLTLYVVSTSLNTPSPAPTKSQSEPLTPTQTPRAVQAPTPSPLAVTPEFSSITIVLLLLLFLCLALALRKRCSNNTSGFDTFQH
jgi:hypothetical protein